MMHELVARNRAAIVADTTEAARLRSSPATTELVENGVPRFLIQLSRALLFGGNGSSTPEVDAIAIVESASRHGAELRALGFTASQIVYAYGDICQAVTGLAIAQNVAITAREFRTLSRCLDDAIAGALTGNVRLTSSV